MKRTPLRRKTPLARKPMRRGKSRTKYARRDRDMPYMGWIRSLACCLVGEGWEAWSTAMRAYWRGPDFAGMCRGLVEAHHAGDRAYGRKSEDTATLPLCEAHHRVDDIGITRRRGPFAGWPRGDVHRWELAMIEVYRRRYADRMAGLQEIAL